MCHPFPPKPPAVLDSMNNTLTYETTSSAHHRYPSASHQRPIGISSTPHRHLIDTPSAGISSTPRGTHFAGSLGDSVAQVEDCLDYFKQRVKYFFKTKQDFIPQGKNRQHAYRPSLVFAAIIMLNFVGCPSVNSCSSVNISLPFQSLGITSLLLFI